MTWKTMKLLETKFPIIPLGINIAASFPKSFDAFFSNTKKKNNKQSQNVILYSRFG